MTMPSLTLLLPAVDCTDHGGPAVPALQSLLSKGSREPLRENFTTTLCAHFGLHAEKGGELPLAALGALGDGLAAESGWWLHADPVHLVADRDQLYLSASEALQLTQGEADTLLAELNRTYAEEGWQFFAPKPQRWYLRLPQPLAMRTTPTAEAMGRGVGELLPQGGDAMGWQRVMTEVQMVLHASPVNARRAEQGKLAVNGVWFWGGGQLPAATGDVSCDRVVADDSLSCGLAKRHGLQPDSPSLRELSGTMGEVLWVASSMPSAQQGVVPLDELEQKLFAPLLAMLQRGELLQLVIELPGQGRWRVDRAALRRWWRRRKPLRALLKGSE
jgi:hypothetical protein